MGGLPRGIEPKEEETEEVRQHHRIWESQCGASQEMRRRSSGGNFLSGDGGDGGVQEKELG